MEDKTQKEKIREKWKDTTEIANNFLHYVKMSGNSVLNADAIADYWLNELDLAIKETEGRVVREIKEKNAPEIEKINTYIAGKQGEWCICGAWKQYGVADNHHCTGYRVTC